MMSRRVPTAFSVWQLTKYKPSGKPDNESDVLLPVAGLLTTSCPIVLVTDKTAPTGAVMLTTSFAGLGPKLNRSVLAICGTWVVSERRY